MKWSWTIGRIAGIELRVHATFLLLLAWLALVDYRATGTLSGALLGVLFVLALFASVVLHEFGHALVARSVGVPTRDITLLPIGGIARLEYIPEEPKRELRIALAGPAVTAGIAIILALVLALSGQPLTIGPADVARGSAFVVQLMWMNVVLLLFNLLPAFPMDGGRVLRAALATRMDYARATEVAARTGRVFAMIFGVIGLFYNPFLVLIAIFVWISAAAESSAIRERSALSTVPVRRLMIQDVRTLNPSDSVQTALQHVLTGFQHDFPVVEGDRVVGVLTRSALLAAVARDGAGSRVGDWMETSFVTVEPDELASVALVRLRECRCLTLPVISGGTLAGLLTADNIAEYVAIDAAMHAGERPGGSGFGGGRPSRLSTSWHGEAVSRERGTRDV